MPQNIFKIYDGRTNFWQWDTKQKLIVLDECITEVRFSNRDMEHSKRRPVYTDKDGTRICNVPDLLLQLPKNLIAYACIKNDDGTCSTVKAVKFAVYRQPIPSDYICEQDSVVDGILLKLELLEAMLKDVEQGVQEIKRFDNMVDAEQWAKEHAQPGTIIAVKIDGDWVPHTVEEDYSLDPICDYDGDMMTIVIDCGDADGIDDDIEEEEEVDVIQYFDGGSAFGI